MNFCYIITVGYVSHLSPAMCYLVSQSSLYYGVCRHCSSDLSCGQWRRQLWGTGARAPLDFSTISFLVHFGVNLIANYASIV